MKKTIVLLIGLLIAGALSAQTQNAYKYELKARGGITVGLNGVYSGSTFTLDADSKIKKIDSLTVDNTTTPTGYAVVIAGDTLNPILSTSGYEDAYTYLARKFLTDTTLLTSATYTLVATDAGKVIRCDNATYQEITIPANTMAVGSVVTFVKWGAGPVRINPGASTFRYSVLDSCTMNTQYQWYQVIFRTANKAEFVGDWRD